MTTTVESQTHATLGEIMAALFPCASITGAPKVRTMEIIARLEAGPRNVYTGCVGLIRPGGDCRFNVAIRTVAVDRHKAQAEYGVGGGIVWDSRAESEYEECRIKARVLTASAPRFQLLESLLWTPEGGLWLLDEHLDRLAGSARYFRFPVDREALRRRLVDYTQQLHGGRFKVRLLVDNTGRATFSHAPVEPNPDHPVPVCISKHPVDSRDRFLYHKTTHRHAYEQAMDSLLPGAQDAVLVNEHGQITETTVANLVVEIQGRLLTPAWECGLLPGTFRNHLLAQGKIHEAVLTPGDLERASRFFLINSVRGFRPARLAAHPATS